MGLKDALERVAAGKRESGPSIFVGLINKVNADEMKNIALDLLTDRCKDNMPERYTPNDRGFCAQFASPEKANRAVDELEDAPLANAVDNHVSARVHIEDEAHGVTATVERMERELWIYIERYPEVDDDIEYFSECLTDVKLMKPTGIVVGKNGTAEQELQKRRSMILEISYPNSNKYVKFVIPMISSEAAYAVASAEFRLPKKYGFRFHNDTPRLQVSRACHHKHRFDVESSYLQLPCGNTKFDEKLFDKWNFEADLGLGNMRMKVKNEKARQVFREKITYGRAQQILKRVADTPYRGVNVQIVSWLDMVLYDTILQHVEESCRKRLIAAIEGVADNYPSSSVAPQSLMPSLVSNNEGDDDRDVQYYFDISVLEVPVEINVTRPAEFVAEKGSMQFVDVFVFTTGNLLPAYKRADTLKKLQPQLDDAIDFYGADGGMLLNHHLSLDTLGRVVYYFWFSSEMYMREMVKDIKNKHFVITDVVQQTAGRPFATSYSVGDGFTADFPARCKQMMLDLVDISKVHLHQNYNR